MHERVNKRTEYLLVVLSEMARREIEIEGQTPLFNEKLKLAHRAFLGVRWNEFKKILEEDKRNLLEWFDLFGNTAIHVATRSNNPQLLKELLEMLPEAERWRALRMGNRESNTVLHEVIFCKMVEMADVLFELEKKLQPPPEEDSEESKRPLLEFRNNKGETPFFRAAKHGKLKMLKHMANYMVGDMQSHFHRDDKFSILHASVTGQFFGMSHFFL